MAKILNSGSVTPKSGFRVQPTKLEAFEGRVARRQASQGVGMRRKNSKSFNFKIIHITRKRTKYLRNWYQNYENWSRNKKVIEV